jgi:transcriptional antiterminator Rof (Rho-off)
MKYEPISCSLYDRIESLAIKKLKVKLEYLDEQNQTKEISGVIENVFSKDNSEFLVVGGKKIRLDFIKSINEL